MDLATLSACTGARLDRAAPFAPWLTDAMDEYGIDTPMRQAAFLAQIGHESGGLHWLTELWGPTDAQRRYEGRIELGNRLPGDGYRFRGHGLIQITGRANHARVRDRLRAHFGPTVPDFEASPDDLALPQWASLSAADFWQDRKLNDLADDGNIERITRIINGGLNGLTDRLALYAGAKTALGVG